MRRQSRRNINRQKLGVGLGNDNVIIERLPEGEGLDDMENGPRKVELSASTLEFAALVLKAEEAWIGGVVDRDEHEANQLHTARYAFHCVRRKVYGDAVMAQQITIEQAEQHYAAAMANYDQLIAEAGSGHIRDANEAEMAKGFYL